MIVRDQNKTMALLTLPHTIDNQLTVFHHSSSVNYFQDSFYMQEYLLFLLGRLLVIYQMDLLFPIKYQPKHFQTLVRQTMFGL